MLFLSRSITCFIDIKDPSKFRILARIVHAHSCMMIDAEGFGLDTLETKPSVSGDAHQMAHEETIARVVRATVSRSQ